MRSTLHDMAARVDSKAAARPVTTALLGLALGAVIAGVTVFTLMDRSPDQPGTGPCADAAEAWAQIDETARTGYSQASPGSNVLVPSTELMVARARGLELLKACRAASE